jgi:hypothetical protein
VLLFIRQSYKKISEEPKRNGKSKRKYFFCVPILNSGEARKNEGRVVCKKKQPVFEKI